MPQEPLIPRAPCTGDIFVHERTGLKFRLESVSQVFGKTNYVISQVKVLFRSEWDYLTSLDRAQFMASGGSVIEDE